MSGDVSIPPICTDWQSRIPRFFNRSGDGRHLSVEPADPDLDSLDEADEGDEYSNADLDSEMDEIRQKMMDLQVKTKDN